MSETELEIGIVGKEETLLKSLLKFYKDDIQHLNIVSAISKQRTIISLREIDYTVTNYSNNNKVSYKLKDGNTFNMYRDYKCQLRGYSKKNFDPFCRRQRLFVDFATCTPTYIEYDEIETYKEREDGVVTTIGQLAFFRWAINNEIIEFCFNNKQRIYNEMETLDQNKPSKSTKTPKVPKKDKQPKKNKKDIQNTQNTNDTSCTATIESDTSDEIKVIIKF